MPSRNTSTAADVFSLSHQMIPALAIAASGVAFFLSSGLGVLWPLAWLAPIPVLLVAFKRSRRTAALIAFFSYFLGSFTILGLFRVGGLIIFAAPPTIAFTLAVLATKSAISRLPAWAAALVFPAVFTAYEFLYSSISPNGTYWSLGYSQTDFLSLLQIVSITGLWGVIFLLTLVPSAVAVSWHRRTPSPLVPAFLLLLCAVGYGTVRLSGSRGEGGGVVGVTALDSAGGSASDLARAYSDRIRKLAAEGAEIVVVPEKLVEARPPDEDAAMQPFRDVARTARVAIVVGLNRTTTPRHNVAVVIGRRGEVIAEYEKHHLVPLIESAFAAGTAPRLFEGPRSQWGVEICKDMDFPAWSREYGRRGVRLLAVPALDFVKDGRVHSRMALTRGVENGFAVARAAGQGRVTLSDAYGRVLVEQESAADGQVVQHLEAGPGATVYTKYGDWFGWVTVLILVALLVAMVVPVATAGRK